MCFSLIKAAFIFTILSSFASAKEYKTAKFNASTHFNKVKLQIVDLLEKNKRSTAMTLIENELLRDDKEYKNKLNSLKFNMLNDFLALPTQEVYETSIGLILNDKKKALSGLQQCLTLEPENLQCRWLELKYHRRYNMGIFNEKAVAYIETAQNFKQLQLLKNSLLVALGRAGEIVNNSNNKDNKTLNSEDSILENIINYSSAIQAENYLKAKEVYNYMNIHYADYPDLIFMSYQLSKLWPEGVSLSESNLEKKFEVYQKKCADLPASLARKYFFDISLCVRSL
jgi:hypothetical protein